MKLLLIDTCGPAGSIALADTGPSNLSPEIVATASLPGRTASERLVPAIKALIADHGATLQSLGAIAVVHGPGSFTGIRVGLSAAKGLCEALGVPPVAISRLAVLADMASPPPPAALSSQTDPPVAHRIHAFLDAGREEFYYGDYAGALCLREALLTHDEALSTIINPAAGVPQDCRALSPSKGEAIAETLTFASLQRKESTAPEHSTVVTCEPTVAESLVPLTPQLVAEPTAADALPLAMRRIGEGSFDDAATIDANYVRRTDAQIFAKPSAKSKLPAAPAIEFPWARMR
jgi:tRNA threonylcarbamoyladenosine biosynthesis protein TsaB